MCDATHHKPFVSGLTAVNEVRRHILYTWQYNFFLLRKVIRYIVSHVKFSGFWWNNFVAIFLHDALRVRGQAKKPKVNFRRIICDVTHHKSYGLALTAVSEVRWRIVYILVYIIIFLHRYFYDLLCVMLSFQILENFHILENF